MKDPSLISRIPFGDFELDLESGELLKNGRKIRLQAQPFQVLRVLLEKPGRVVTREELQQKLWPKDTFVDFEHGLNAAINRLRQVLDDSADASRYIETLPRRGYRFIFPLGHYQIASQLGKDGMGEVYQAKDQKLGRDVAIKLLPEEFAKDSDRVAWFQREAKLLASLNHPNIAAIYGLEESGGTNFLVLELVEGATLADQIKKGPILVEEALKLALQIAEALEAAL